MALPNIPDEIPSDPLAGQTTDDNRIAWDPVAGVFIALVALTIPGIGTFPPGAPIPFEVVRLANEAIIAAVSTNMVGLSTQLQTAEITLAEWQLGMMQEIKNLHTSVMVASGGGWPQMSFEDLEFIAGDIQAQLNYLNNFAQQIESGAYAIDGQRFVMRTDMYSQAARGASSRMRGRFIQISQRPILERRILGIADHCNSAGGLEGCMELAAKGWQPVGSLPDIGVSPCRVNCKCHKEYMLEDGSIMDQL